MRKAALYIVLSFLFPPFLSAQSKQANTWILGYPTAIPDMPNTERFGGMYMKFDDSAYRIENFDIIGGSPSVVANDQAGNLLFYYNGCYIYNRQHQVMDNGNDINVGSAGYEYLCTNPIGVGYLGIRSGDVALPLPENEKKHYLFHLSGIHTSDTSGIFNKVFYSEIDMGSGLGRVIQKNQILLTDSLHDAVAAVRHGNGRDWWIVIPRGTNRQFWKILLSPEGPGTPTLQTLPPPYSPFTVTYKVNVDFPPFELTLKPNEYGFESWAGQAIFSPDGAKYCRIVRSGDVEIYDFDRCSGELRLRRLIPVPPYKHYPELYQVACGLAVSPNSRYLYFNTNEELYQFDMCEAHLEEGDYELIAEWDRNLQDTASNFFQMRNGPDGKIYMGSSTSVRGLHVIHEPDRAGQACHFEQHGVVLPRFSSWIINYFPNFNLYDLPGSPCDTLSIDDLYPHPPVYTFDEVRIFPNPANEEVKLYLPQCDGVRVQVWNITGQLVRDLPFVPGMTAYSLDVSAWASGAYIVAVYVDAKKPVIKRLIVTH